MITAESIHFLSKKIRKKHEQFDSVCHVLYQSESYSVNIFLPFCREYKICITYMKFSLGSFNSEAQQDIHCFMWTNQNDYLRLISAL